MQDIYATCEADRVHGTISIASVVFYDFQNARTVKAMERLGIAVLSATLGYVESVPNRVFHIFWKEARSALVLPIQTTGLMLGDAVTAMLCLNEHNRQYKRQEGWFLTQKRYPSRIWKL